MILYHGTTEIVDAPEIRKGNNFLDFGYGFYTTSSFEQAQRWAKIKMRRNKSNIGYICIYEFDYDSAIKNFNVKKFSSADKEWLLFVVANRKGDNCLNGADMHIGPVADDNVYQSVRLFETGAYDVDYTVKRLKTETLHDQWAFHTQEILNLLKFKGVKEVII